MKAGADHISPDEYGRTSKSLARKLDNDATLKVMDPYKSGFGQIMAPRKASTGVRTLTTELRSLSEELLDMPAIPVDLKNIPYRPFKSPQLERVPWAVEEIHEVGGDETSSGMCIMKGIVSVEQDLRDCDKIFPFVSGFRLLW